MSRKLLARLIQTMLMACLLAVGGANACESDELEDDHQHYVQKAQVVSADTAPGHDTKASQSSEGHDNLSGHQKCKCCDSCKCSVCMGCLGGCSFIAMLPIAADTLDGLNKPERLLAFKSHYHPPALPLMEYPPRRPFQGSAIKA